MSPSELEERKARLTEMARRCWPEEASVRCEIVVDRGGKTCGVSIVRDESLAGVHCGDHVMLHCGGPDAEGMVGTMERGLSARLGEKP